ncbi:efflux RND transporter periplasmic adaptor subunit [Rhizobium halophytocola]|uniref:Membrane fusion protein (Multidrug efflux system) n=1 Tax=Rhizobium halophytocola TaxID=735519 RepID=A0ABS4DUU5_9HYPH|nr:efflux RND transporter periplasmic adaptor subunit [Rhizobium halophytocola]MBP1849456.1 membrane fusion protein (multidrug efflux system) [Rhizobium halophytocola]
MTMGRHYFIVAGKRATLMSLALLVACSADDAENKPDVQKVEVGYVSLTSQSVPQLEELRGRVVAYATAEVRPQVDGIVRSIDFTEGREVKQGDTLYEIDPRKFQAAYASAEAALKKAEAASQGYQATYDRNKTLARTNAVSAQTLDDAQSNLLQAQASEEAARADLDAAKIDLDNATIKAPIGGMIGTSSVSVGALVTENQTDALVTIRQIRPIHVDLVDTSANMLRVRSEIDAGQLGRERDGPATTTLTLENGKAYDEQGEVSFADMVVSEETGTFTVRATFPNERRILVPGMFVTAKVHFGNLTNAFLVPQRALTRSDDGTATVYLVSDDGKAKKRSVTTNGTSGNDWIVTDGLKNGDKLIVDGFQKLEDGKAVTAVVAEIDENGVVKQSLTSGSTADTKSADQKEAGQ